MELHDLISASVAHPIHALPYEVSRTLAEHFAGKFILEIDGCSFAAEDYARKGFCRIEGDDAVHSRVTTAWYPQYGLYRNIEFGLFDIHWRERVLKMVVVVWPNPMHGKTEAVWLIGDRRHDVEEFYITVNEWHSEVKDEVLVFMDGHWGKNAKLHEAIQSSSFDNLILPPTLERELKEDLEHFFSSQAMYEKYGIPWKRGILMMGPPGNGKTHAVKALINRTGKPCLYVKSFKSQYGTDHANVRAVFERARETTPCLLVLEDLDTLLNDKNRSFFLNEMDGFETNSGVVVLATTNHPERLDPAIVDRPSRFDRKYHFELPEVAERLRYLAVWNERAEPELRIQEDAVARVAEATAGFSFAYLKELWLSAMMAWIARPGQVSMDTIMISQVETLRAQMVTQLKSDAPDLSVLEENEDEEE